MNDEQFRSLGGYKSAIDQAADGLRNLVCELIPPDECRKTPDTLEDSQNTSQQLKGSISELKGYISDLQKIFGMSDKYYFIVKINAVIAKLATQFHQTNSLDVPCPQCMTHGLPKKFSENYCSNCGRFLQ